VVADHAAGLGECELRAVDDVSVRSLQRRERGDRECVALDDAAAGDLRAAAYGDGEQRER
jgi:hypothetical protein